jgi:hypothetical protein
VYTLSETGWRKVPPVLRAIAVFGLDLLDPAESTTTPLNAFLAGILLGLDPARATDLAASYRIDIEGRSFEFAVDEAGLAPTQGPPTVTVTASAADLITARLSPAPAERKSALKRVRFEGHHDDVDAMRCAFQLTAHPGLTQRR